MDLALNNLQWLICHKTKPNREMIKSWYLWFKKKINFYKKKSCLVNFYFWTMC